jgi:hypothetical protein
MKQQKQQAFANNSRRIATPVSGFLSGKCYAAPIMRERGSIIPTYYLCVPRAEALLMVSNTSYLNVYRDASAFHIVFVHCSSSLNF